MRKFFYLLFLCWCSVNVFSQNASIKGIVKDTSTNTLLKFASIQLLRAKDSVLVTFTRTDATGSFQTKAVPSGSYILLITYPKYADYADVVSLQKEEDLGQLALLTQATALQNVIVRGGGAIRLKGDTTAFMADSFKVREGSSVEDLLKRLPGFTVNKKGEITAQGEKVEKVLVDGEEFFGGDPTMATQNLQAAAVKEVQLFDKKSDQATFTGIDDGEKTKTINLKLKDEAKKGYFGKLKLGGGVPNRYENSLMANSFRDKKKISAYGQMSNTGKTGLNWDEDRNYGGGMNSNTETDDDGNTYYYSNGDDFGGGGGSYGGQGIPRSWNGGINFGNKWNNDKSNLNGNYRYQKINTDGTTSTQTQYILPPPDTSYNINEVSRFKTRRERQQARGTYDITLDSMSSLRFTADGSIGKNISLTEYNRQTMSIYGRMINEQARTTNVNSKNGTFNSSGLWRKKFKKTGRTFSLNFSQKYQNSDGTTFLKSNERYFSSGQLTKDTLTDQMKIADSWSLGLNTKASYTEPLSKYSLIEVNYGYNVLNSENAVSSFDKVNDKYDKLNLLTSNDYRFTTQTHSGGASYAYNYKKIKLGFGGNVARSLWNQDDLRKDTSRNYNFTNLFPRANFTYKFSKQSSFRLNYNGNTQAPSLDQIQPLVNNLDPLNIAIGNPALKQAFNNNINIGYNNYQVLTEKSIYANVSLNTTSNAFSSSDRVDSGRRYYQTVNVSGNYNVRSYLSYSFKWKKPDLRINLNANSNNRRNRNFINSKLNTTNSQEYTIGASLSKYVENKFNFWVNSDVTRNLSTSSVQPDLATRYWSGSVNADGNVDLPKNFSINTDLNYEWRQRTPVFTSNNSVFLWNASFEKRIFKKKTATIGIKVYDILNNNQGVSRDINSNYIRQRNYDVVRRYALLSFTWNFAKNGKPEGW